MRDILKAKAQNDQLRNSQVSGSSFTHIVDFRVHSLGIHEPLYGRIVSFPDTDADPDIAVNAHDDIHSKRSAWRRKGVEVRFQSSDEGWRNSEQETVSKLKKG